MTVASDRPRRGVSVIVTAVAVLTVAGAFLVLSRVVRPPAAAAAAQPAAAATAQQTPSPLDDSSLLPTPSVSPADKATIQPPTNEPSQPWSAPTGVLAQIEVPMGSIRFVANNGWSGYLGDQRIVIAAGVPGYDHAKDGALFVATLKPEGGIASSFFKVADGAGAFTIQSGENNAGLHITSQSGQSYYYDLSSQTLSQTGTG